MSNIKCKNIFITLCLLVSTTVFAQWDAPCTGSYYCDLGPLSNVVNAVQTVPNSQYCAVLGPSGHTNTFNTGTSLYIKTSFTATAGVTYCFSLDDQGTGTGSSNASGNTGNSIEFLNGPCDWVGTAGTGNPGSAVDVGSPGFTQGTSVGSSENYGCVKYTAATTGTVYIQLASGPSGAATFGYAGSDFVTFTYAQGPCSCGSSKNIVVLPIELVRFVARLENEQAKLEWSTANELNNDYFTLERSADAILFTPVKTIKGAGNSSRRIDYSAIDEEPLSGITYYRLKQTDKNGKFAYSKIISTAEVPIFGALSPNPARSYVNFNLFSPISGVAKIQLMDVTGRVVLDKDERVEEGTQVVNTVLDGLENGAYYFRTSIDEIGYSNTTKLIKR